MTVPTAPQRPGLGRGPRTVNGHLRPAFGKLGITSQVALTRMISF